jgi:hypothetical protein
MSGTIGRKGVGVVVELVNDLDYVYMLLVGAAVGAVGGLGAELLLKRAGNTGTMAMPHRLKGTNLVEIGFPASVIVGAIAAVAVLYFFPPVIEKVASGVNGAAPTTTNEYDVAKLVPLSLIVGSAGPAFLATAQSRLMSALNAQKAGTLVDTGKNQVDQIAASATAAVAGAVQQAVSQHIPGTDAKVVQEMAEAASASLGDTLKPQIEVAHEQVDAIAPTVSVDDPSTGR